MEVGESCFAPFPIGALVEKTYDSRAVSSEWHESILRLYLTWSMPPTVKVKTLSRKSQKWRFPQGFHLLCLLGWWWGRRLGPPLQCCPLGLVGMKIGPYGWWCNSLASMVLLCQPPKLLGASSLKESSFKRRLFLLDCQASNVIFLSVLFCFLGFDNLSKTELWGVSVLSLLKTEVQSRPLMRSSAETLGFEWFSLSKTEVWGAGLVSSWSCSMLTLICWALVFFALLEIFTDAFGVKPSPACCCQLHNHAPSTSFESRWGHVLCRWQCLQPSFQDLKRKRSCTQPLTWACRCLGRNLLRSSRF